MQVKDHFLLSKKQYEDEKLAEINLKYALLDWFNNIFKILLSDIHEDDNNIKFLYQVEQVINNHKTEYQDILADNIHDYYVQTSETQEAIINNTVASKMTDNSLLIMASKADYNLDDWLYDYQSQEEINKEIRRKLLLNSNTQTTLNRYIYNHFDLRGLKPTDFTIEELLEFEIDEAVVEYMTNNVFIATERTLERVTQEIYDIIIESYAEQGEGIDSVTQTIMDKFTELAEYEAQRIARTETSKAQGNATYNRLINNPDVEYIQWMATDDERTRDSHAEIDGEITYADGTGIFSNGLQYPGDTNGDIEEWINCRCDLVAYIPDAGFVPPSGAENWYEDEMLFDTGIDIPEVYVEMDEYLASYW